MTATVVQLSDTHLSARHGYFLANWRRVVRRLNQEPPDLVITTGDLSVNGSDDDEDLAFAIAEHRRLRSPWQTIPGNHDIGEEPGAIHLGQPISEERLNRWERIVGAQWWHTDIEAWRLIGINGFLYGTGLPAETAQHEWLERTLTAAPGPVGLFVHKPLFIDHADEPGGTRAFTASNREGLTRLLPAHDVRFIASGHLHQSTQRTWNDISLIWAPSTAFPASEPHPDARPGLGWILHRFDGQDHETTLVEAPELDHISLASLKHGGRYAFLYQTPPSPPDLGYLADEG